MRLIRWFVLAAIAIVLVVIAVANDGPLTIRLLPDELGSLLGLDPGTWAVTLPVFIILFIAMFVGVVLGYVLEWVREHKHRAVAAVETRERQRLQKQVKDIAPPSADDGDDVLAMLEAR